MPNFKSKDWDGVFCALWTPTDHSGRVLEKSLQANLAFLAGKNLRGLLALGSTGEFLHLDVPARKRFLESVLKRANALRILANISDIRPHVVADLGRHAKAAGADAVSILPPYFFPMSQTDLVEFFVRAGRAARLPVFLYNFPERTGNRIGLETVAAVADRIPLAGVKQSGAEFEYHRALVQLGRKKNFVVFTGSDTRLPEAMAMGVSGCVSGLANAVPELVTAIFDGIEAGNPPRGSIAVERMKRIAELVDQLEFPLNVSAIIKARGLSPGHPKTVVSPETKDRRRKLVAEFRRWFREWGLL